MHPACPLLCAWERRMGKEVGRAFAARSLDKASAKGGLPTQGEPPSLPAGWHTEQNSMVSKAQDSKSHTLFIQLLDPCPQPDSSHFL